MCKLHFHTYGCKLDKSFADVFQSMLLSIFVFYLCSLFAFCGFLFTSFSVSICDCNISVTNQLVSVKVAYGSVT